MQASVRFRSESVHGIKFSAGAEGRGYDALITLEVIISQPGCPGSNTLTEWSNQAAHPITGEHDGLHVTQGFLAYSDKCDFFPLLLSQPRHTCSWTIKAVVEKTIHFKSESKQTQRTDYRGQKAVWVGKRNAEKAKLSKKYGSARSGKQSSKKNDDHIYKTSKQC